MKEFEVYRRYNKFLFYLGINSLVKEANRVYNLVETESTPQHQITAMAELIFSSKTVNSNLKNAIKEEAHVKDIIEYMKDKYDWTQGFFDSIDWRSHGKAYASLPTLAQISVSKCIHKWRPTLTRLHKFDPEKYPCPQCVNLQT